MKKIGLKEHEAIGGVLCLLKIYYLNRTKVGLYAGRKERDLMFKITELADCLKKSIEDVYSFRKSRVFSSPYFGAVLLRRPELYNVVNFYTPLSETYHGLIANTLNLIEEFCDQEIKQQDKEHKKFYKTTRKHCISLKDKLDTLYCMEKAKKSEGGIYNRPYSEGYLRVFKRF